MKDTMEDIEIKVPKNLSYYYAYAKYLCIHHLPFLPGEKLQKSLKRSAISTWIFRIWVLLFLMLLTFQEITEISKFGFAAIWASPSGRKLILQVTLAQIIMIVGIFTFEAICSHIVYLITALKIRKSDFAVRSFLLKAHEISISMGTYGSLNVPYDIFAKIEVTQKSIAFIMPMGDKISAVFITRGLVGDERKWGVLCDYFSGYRLG